MSRLPELNSDKFIPTRDYLRQICLVLSELQRLFILNEDHDWQYGLEVGLRGIITQPFDINNNQYLATLDFVKQKVRLDNNKWDLKRHKPKDLLKNINDWLNQNAIKTKLDDSIIDPTITKFDKHQVDNYANALWAINSMFLDVKQNLKGLVSPTLLYPHHFDLAQSWFPASDDNQVTLGFSTGDENINEPYIYLTMSPKDQYFDSLSLTAPAYMNHTGFDGAILLYKDLLSSQDYRALFNNYYQESLIKAASLF